MKCTVVALALVGLCALPAHGQELTDIEALAAGGRFTQARAALQQWQAAHPAPARDQRTHALALQARLAQDADQARDAWLAIALGHPTSAHAPLALLRLGQLLLAEGDTQRARSYLERLERDYPNATVRAEGIVWLARTLRREGERARACTVAGSITTTDADVAELLARERDAACAG